MSISTGAVKEQGAGESAPFTSWDLPQSGSQDFVNARAQFMERFKAQGLPSAKWERFKYTNLIKTYAAWNDALKLSSVAIKADEGDYIYPLKDYLEVEWVKELLEAPAPGEDKYKDMALWNLNAAYVEEGLVIDIPDNSVIEEPINIGFDALEGTYSAPRLIIRLGQGAQATIAETQSGHADYWKNGVIQVVVGKNAKLNHVRINQDSDQSVVLYSAHIALERDAQYHGFALNIGGQTSRYYAHADLLGDNGVASFDGLNLLGDAQHGDTTILIEHQAPNCMSNQFYRTLLKDQAHGVFQGKVHVHKPAQRTDGYQLANTILLSQEAEMDTKPELEIYADDVKCSHGATTGQLDEEPLFYLRSRGLSDKEARLLLIQAFVGEVVEKIENEMLRTTIEKDVGQWLIQAL